MAHGVAERCAAARTHVSVARGVAAAGMKGKARPLGPQVFFPGPLSVAFLSADFPADIARGLSLLDLGDQSPPRPSRITLSVVKDEGYRSPRNRFPFNLLRNRAVAACSTSAVLTVDVDFVLGGGASHIGRMRALGRLVGQLQRQPNVVYVLPAFEVNGEYAAQAGVTPAAAASTPRPSASPSSIVSTSRGTGRRLRTVQPHRRSKIMLRDLWERGEAETFAARQYWLGHVCDDSRRWLNSDSAYEAPYQFGCEPYVLLLRDSAPKYDEHFVGYGKDRVSFTYELVARGAKLVVQADIYVVHFTTVQSGVKYEHAPSDWMVGETCWPQFRRRIRDSTGFDEVGSTQPIIDRQVSRRFGRRGELEARCVAEEEALCVHPCRPETAVFRANQAVEMLRPLNRSSNRRHRPLSAPSASTAECVDQAPAHDTGTSTSNRSCSRSMDHPTIFVVGCDRCASNALAALLELQPGAAMGMPIEGEAWWAGENPSFFSQEDHYARGLDWYLAHFRGVATRPTNSSRQLIDGSKSMLAAFYAAARLRYSLSESAHRHRIIIVLRNPVDLAVALWRSIRRLPLEQGLGSLLGGYIGHRDFERKVLEETAGLVSCLDVGSWSTAPRQPSKQTYAKNSSISLHVWQQCIATECGWPGCIVGTGLFAPQIRAWRMVYPPEQVAVFTLGELARSPAAALRRLFQFSGVQPPPGLAQAVDEHHRSVMRVYTDGELAMDEAFGTPTSTGRRLLSQDDGELVESNLPDGGAGRSRFAMSTDRLAFGRVRRGGRQVPGRRSATTRHGKPAGVSKGFGKRLRRLHNRRGKLLGGRKGGRSARKIERGSLGQKARKKLRVDVDSPGEGYSLPDDYYKALGAKSAISHLRSEVDAVMAEGRGATLSAIRILRRFFARYAPALRYELRRLKQDLSRWRLDEWLWDDEENYPPEVGEEARVEPDSSVIPAASATSRADLAMLPSVFLIGGEKCGSTSLAFAVSRHPQLHLARHTLPAEPAYFRKELHFFDDDLRFARGLGFYAAHYPRCSGHQFAAGRPSGMKSYWSGLPRKGVEILLEDVRSGETVGWDAELNIPTNAHKTVMLLPAFPSSNQQQKNCGVRCRSFWLVDAASHKLLYLRDWVLRAMPLAFTDEKRMFVLVPANPKPGEPSSFYLVDRASGRMLYWRDDVVRVRPFRRDPSASWRLQRVSDSECPHWADVLSRGNQSAAHWAVRIAEVVLGECDASCMQTARLKGQNVGRERVTGIPLPKLLAPHLDPLLRIESGTRISICVLSCKLASRSGKASRRLPGCICETTPPRPDCTCGGGVGRGPHLNVDATPLMHRLPAVWRMQAKLPRSLAPRFIVMLRQPELRTASHFQMLQKLARRGEEWAKLYVGTHTIDSKLRSEARAISTCIHSRLRATGSEGDLSPKMWHDCVAVACSFHACVVGQSIYVAQLKAWINTFGSKQLLVLTLDDFAASAKNVLASVSNFLGVGPFPRLVLNWKWTWNTNAKKSRLGEANNGTIAELRAFFAPYNDALIELLRKRRQPMAAHSVGQWQKG
ncbi:hypothetical protein AB1Y20_011104 [Prymnesium parvum]|uniref:Sulfotransferase domain-containing protein n=1 Tax=Prymnesium parvum TaxID=97485 RepID=A0AB34IPF9_PRYPA